MHHNDIFHQAAVSELNNMDKHHVLSFTNMAAPLWRNNGVKETWKQRADGHGVDQYVVCGTLEEKHTLHFS